MGSGRTEVVRAIFGIIDPLDSRGIYINGKKVMITTSREAIKRGLYIMPADIRVIELVIFRSILENLILANLDKFTKLYFLNKKKELKVCKKMINLLSIKTQTPNEVVEFLSGAN